MSHLILHYNWYSSESKRVKINEFNLCMYLCVCECVCLPGCLRLCKRTISTDITTSKINLLTNAKIRLPKWRKEKKRRKISKGPKISNHMNHMGHTMLPAKQTIILKMSRDTFIWCSYHQYYEHIDNLQKGDQITQLKWRMRAIHRHRTQFFFFFFDFVFVWSLIHLASSIGLVLWISHIRVVRVDEHVFLRIVLCQWNQFCRNWKDDFFLCFFVWVLSSWNWTTSLHHHQLMSVSPVFIGFSSLFFFFCRYWTMFNRL